MHRSGATRADMERQAVWGECSSEGSQDESEPDQYFRSTAVAVSRVCG